MWKLSSPSTGVSVLKQMEEACVKAARAEGFAGRSCFDDYQDGFHDRLAASWPEKREQLHAGAERITDKMVAELEALAHDGEAPQPFASGTRVLDVCCGEGATAIALAKRFPLVEFVGIDIVCQKILIARPSPRALCVRR